MRYQIDLLTSRRARHADDTAGSDIFGAAFDILNYDSDLRLSYLHYEEVLEVATIMEHIAVAYFSDAYCRIERRILPRVLEHGRVWHAHWRAVMATLLIYLCDFDAALKSLECLSAEDFADYRELLKIKGIAHRLAGHRAEALNILANLVKDPQTLCDETRLQILLAEAQAFFDGVQPSDDDLKRFQEKNKYLCHSQSPIVQCGLYRFAVLAGRQEEQDILLQGLNELLIWTRPFATAMLQDILPGPLHQVVLDARPAGWAWEPST